MADAVATPADTSAPSSYSTTEYELISPQEVRLARNATENRISSKPSKANADASNARLINEDTHYRLVGYDEEAPFHNYIRSGDGTAYQRTV